MLCYMMCAGKLADNPKRYYTKKSGNEMAIFSLLIKRNNGRNEYDCFQFDAYGRSAKYINENLHRGDVVTILCRPIRHKYKTKDGKNTDRVIFRVMSLNYICHKNKIMVNQFGGYDFPELTDIDYGFGGEIYHSFL